jgi:DNA-3-methyladenine glycosylase II
MQVSAATDAVRILHPRPPFRFDLALRYLQRSTLELVEVVVENGVYRRAVELTGGPGVLDVRAVGSSAAPALEVRLLEEIDGTRLDEAAALVARCFRVDEDVSELQALVLGTPGFLDLYTALRGLRAMVLPTAFETLVWAILGQQINIDFAYRLKRRLVETYGTPLERDGQTFLSFPGPERLASVDPDDLRPLQFSRQKAKYVVEAARLVASGAFDLEGLRDEPMDVAHEALVGLHGVGRWTAEYVRMRGLGDRDALPAADVGLRVAAARVHGLERPPTEPELRALAEPLAGWRSYYAFYLWFSLRGLPV